LFQTAEGYTQLCR